MRPPFDPAGTEPRPGRRTLYLPAIGAIQAATPGSLDGGVLAARLVVAAFALAPVGAYLGPSAIVGLLVLALVALTVFEVNRPNRRAGVAEGPAS